MAPRPASSDTAAVLDSLGPDPMWSADAIGRMAGVEVTEVKKPPPAAAEAITVVDPVDYNAMLKQKLEKDLAVVTMWRSSGTMPAERSAAGSSLPNADVSLTGALDSTGGYDKVTTR